MRRLSQPGALRALLTLLTLVGCVKPAALPADLSAAQQAERAPSPQQALSDYDAILAGCRQKQRSETKDPCGTAAIRRAQLLEQAGQAAAAAAAYLEVRSLASDGQTIARALVRAAGLYGGPLGQPSEALRICREVVPRWPDEVAAEDALRLLVDLQTEAQAPDLAAELGRLADLLAGHEVIGSFALYYRAHFYELHGQPELAVASYDAIWQRYPRGPLFDDALVGAAQLLRQQRRFTEAALRLERLESSFTKALLVGHYNKMLLDEGAILLGEVYLQDLGRPEQAISALDRFLHRQRSSLLCDDALLMMAQAALRKHVPATPADRSESCHYLFRLRHDYPDGNRFRQAGELLSRLGCSP